MRAARIFCSLCSNRRPRFRACSRNPKTASAAVEWCREHVRHGMARALVVNSGNANAFTGMRGHEAVRQTVHAGARVAGCLEAEMYVASTGVIGEPLEPQKFVGRLAELAESAEPEAYESAARAIMTTDTFPKLATRRCEIDGVPVTLNGIAKGAGMIAPDMATMLAFLFTDAGLEPAALKDLLAPLVEDSFNAITVDSDTSTSDTVLLFATGAARKRGCPHITRGDDPRLDGFRAALFGLMLDLAHQVVKDGEGSPSS